MRVLDLFSGLGGWSAAFADRDHEVLTVDLDPRFAPDLVADVYLLSPYDLPWQPDIVLASPPCEKFSIMAFGKNWLPGYIPARPSTERAVELAASTFGLIRRAIEPAFFVIENPVGLMRKMDFTYVAERRTITQCHYGETRMKPTDLWGGFPPSLELAPVCRNGDPCHVAAPRGSRTPGSTQGGSDSAERAKIPYPLSLAVCLAAERDLEAGRKAIDYHGRLFA